MRTPGFLTKLAVLLFFITLLSGFVAYRSGMFPDLFGASSSLEKDSTRRTTLTKAEYDSLLKLQPDSMKGQGIRDASGRRVYFMDNDTTPYTILPGSKSLTPIFDPQETQKPATRTYLPTSKSLGGGAVNSNIFDEVLAKYPVDTTKKEPVAREFMGGSKSLSPVFKSTPTQPLIMDSTK